MGKTFWVYIITNKDRSVLYIGMTNDIKRRVSEHRLGEFEGFSKRYNLQHLVCYEAFGTPHEAIARKKKIKHWRRAWKCALVEEDNPNWIDLAKGWGYRQ